MQFPCCDPTQLVLHPLFTSLHWPRTGHLSLSSRRQDEVKGIQYAVWPGNGRRSPDVLVCILLVRILWQWCMLSTFFFFLFLWAAESQVSWWVIHNTLLLGMWSLSVKITGDDTYTHERLPTRRLPPHRFSRLKNERGHFLPADIRIQYQQKACGSWDASGCFDVAPQSFSESTHYAQRTSWRTWLVDLANIFLILAEREGTVETP